MQAGWLLQAYERHGKGTRNAGRAHRWMGMRRCSSPALDEKLVLIWGGGHVEQRRHGESVMLEHQLTSKAHDALLKTTHAIRLVTCHKVVQPGTGPHICEHRLRHNGQPLALVGVCSRRLCSKHTNVHAGPFLFNDPGGLHGDMRGVPALQLKRA